MKKFVFILFVIASCLFSGSYAQEVGRDIYELRQQCGREGYDEFRRTFGKGVVKDRDGVTAADYMAHYNVKLDKCFYLEVTRYLPDDENGIPLMSMSIRDTDERRQYGTFRQYMGSEPLICLVGELRCQSEEEWEELIKPYMEE